MRVSTRVARWGQRGVQWRPAPGRWCPGLHQSPTTRKHQATPPSMKRNGQVGRNCAVPVGRVGPMSTDGIPPPLLGGVQPCASPPRYISSRQERARAAAPGRSPFPACQLMKNLCAHHELVRGGEQVHDAGGQGVEGVRRPELEVLDGFQPRGQPGPHGACTALGIRGREGSAIQGYIAVEQSRRHLNGSPRATGRGSCSTVLRRQQQQNLLHRRSRQVGPCQRLCRHPPGARSPPVPSGREQALRLSTWAGRSGPSTQALHGRLRMTFGVS